MHCELFDTFLETRRSSALSLLHLILERVFLLLVQRITLLAYSVSAALFSTSLLFFVRRICLSWRKALRFGDYVRQNRWNRTRKVFSYLHLTRICLFPVHFLPLHSYLFLSHSLLCFFLWIEPTWCTNYLNTFIAFLYMFRANVCPSSGENYRTYATPGICHSI